MLGLFWVRCTGCMWGLAGAIVFSALDIAYGQNPAADVNNDGIVNVVDVAIVGGCVGQQPAPSSPCAAADVDGGGVIDEADIAIVVANLGQMCSRA